MRRQLRMAQGIPAVVRDGSGPLRGPERARATSTLEWRIGNQMSHAASQSQKMRL
jgi:hypothetical protein